jgi:nucleoside phosphorylase
MGITASNNNRYPFYWQTSNTVAQRSNGTVTTHGSANTSTGWFYATTRRDGTSSIAVRRNGSLLANVTTGLGVTDPASGSWISIGITSGVYTDGDIGEIIVYDTALSDSDIDSVEAYLAEKWAI